MKKVRNIVGKKLFLITRYLPLQLIQISGFDITIIYQLYDQL